MRGFLNFSRNQLPKRAFRARLPQLFTTTCFQNERFVQGFLNFSLQLASKTSVSCEASSTFHYNLLPKRAFRARLPQLFKAKASKTSISCEASATFQSRSFQNEHFVRDFRNFESRRFQSRAPATQNAKMTSHLESLKRQNEHFVRDFLQISHFQLENRRFRASFSYKAIFTELKKYDFCEASASFHDTHQMLRLPRYLQGCHVRASLPLRFAQTAPSPHHQMLCLPRHRERPPHKVLRLPRKNDTLALTHCQSIAPVTQNTKMTSHCVIWDRQNEHFVRDVLHFSHFEGKDWIAMRMYRPMAAN